VEKEKKEIKIRVRFFLLFTFYFSLLLALDLWSKAAVFDWLSRQQGGSVSVIDGFFRLVAVENTGAAFGIATGQTRLLTAVSVIALVVILVIFFFGGVKHKLTHAALGLFAAGVCGNLYDRIFNDGRVRDFIDLVCFVSALG
jgi:signal peptidase II